MSSDEKTIITTERLLFRKMDIHDWDALCMILKDDETMYAYGGAFEDCEVRAWLERQLSRYRERGFGLWAVVLKENRQMIGQCGLTMQPWKNEEVLEIGYLFNRLYWHYGYASEAAQACKKYAFDVLDAYEVCSIIREGNISSENVARRNGMVMKDRWIKYYRGVEMPHNRYVVYR